MVRSVDLYYLALLTIVVGWLASCFPEDHDRCGEGFEFKRNDCYKKESKLSPDDKSNDAGADGESTETEQWIGSPCSCEGELCSLAGVPTIFRGTYLGCDGVPKEWPGALLGCMETYVGDVSIDNYYAQGFCTLIAMGCEGDEIICNAVPLTEGSMTACPKNSVMVRTSYVMSVAGLSATVDQKICAPTCNRDEDCRIDDYDETIDSPGQYECIDKDGVSFCYDARNLPDEYSVEAF